MEAPACSTPARHPVDTPTQATSSPRRVPAQEAPFIPPEAAASHTRLRCRKTLSESFRRFPMTEPKAHHPRTALHLQATALMRSLALEGRALGDLRQTLRNRAIERAACVCSRAEEEEDLNKDTGAKVLETLFVQEGRIKKLLQPLSQLEVAWHSFAVFCVICHSA